MKHVCIVGCGDIGRRVASLCLARGDSVSGLLRNADRARTLQAMGVQTLLADLDQPGSAAALAVADALVFYFAPPPAHGDSDPRLTHFLQAIRRGLPRRVVSISTSAVYGDCGGDWVTEQRAPAPASARGRRRLAAERSLLQWSADTGVPVVILRVPGIYAPDRLPEERLRKGLPLLLEAESPWSNRIHADDLAAVCLAAAAHGRPGAIYNVSDDQPSTMTDYFNRVADYLGLPRPPQLSRAEAQQTLSAGMLSYLEESKRLDNRLMHEELGVELRYPGLSEGLSRSDA